MIHILTFQRALNYGAILQCYGLYEAISKFAECEVLDYRSKTLEDRYKIITPQSDLKSVLKAIILFRQSKRKRLKFSEFIRNNLRMSDAYNEKVISTINWTEEDMFVVGSDQVWNRNLTGNDLNFFLNFASKGKRISYAASVGVTVDGTQKDFWKEALKDFSAVSVRESSVCYKFQSMGIACVQNIDPVFLLDKTRWERVSNCVPDEDNEYILIYLLQKSNSFMQKAMCYANKRGMRVVIISNGVKRDYNAVYIDSCGPAEFLRYFLKASVIFTNSFHGISFSILFEKEFYFEYQGNGVLTNSRIDDIVNLFDLQSQNLTDEKIPLGDHINHDKIHNIIEIQRKDAMCYLKNNLLRR